jgi:hypothetical protein
MSDYRADDTLRPEDLEELGLSEDVARRLPIPTYGDSDGAYWLWQDLAPWVGGEES